MKIKSFLLLSMLTILPLSFAMLTQIDQATSADFTKTATVALPLPADSDAQVPARYSAADLTALAKNIYHEARGEGDIGMVAVAEVTINRANSSQFPNNIKAVVYQRSGGVCQFSWVCQRDHSIRDEKMWLKSVKIAKNTLNDKYINFVGNDVYYQRVRVGYAFHPQNWNHNYRHGVHIGNHYFYTLASD